jgi:hypothetical protein
MNGKVAISKLKNELKLYGIPMTVEQLVISKFKICSILKNKMIENLNFFPLANTVKNKDGRIKALSFMAKIILCSTALFSMLA